MSTNLKKMRLFVCMILISSTAALNSAIAVAKTADDYYTQAQAARKTHNNRLAEASYIRALRQDPSHHKAHSGLVYLRIAKRDFSKALTALEEALKHHPNDGLLWTQKGMVLQQLGRVNEAKIAHETALSIQPNDPRALSESAAFYNSQGNRVMAEELSQRRDEVLDQARTSAADAGNDVITPNPAIQKTTQHPEASDGQ